HYAVFAVVTGFLPWTLVLPEAIWRGVKRASASRRSAGPGVSAFGWARQGYTKVRETEPGMHLALWWAGTTKAVFTISVSKLTTYYLPMFPALAVLTARGLGCGGEPRRITARVLGIFAVAIPTVVLVAPHLIEHILKGDALTSARLALSGAMPIALALVLGAAAGLTGWLFARGRSFHACQAMLAGFALAMLPGAAMIHRFDNVRSTRQILLRNADLIRSADAVISDRSPIGLPEWYLGVPVWYMGAPHDFFSGRDLAPEKGRFLEIRAVPEFLKTHPRTVLLTVLRKREDMQGDYPTFHEVDLDEGNVLLASPEVK
ncbi:MAG: hypothetical protein K8T20_05195, partial [Planctomycetes bacterium]|nr:hypothetical protein [Planctomycetota bacterium]